MNDSSVVQDTILPVTKSLVVKQPIAAAFRLFTSEIGRWWPLNTHSVFGEAAKTCVVDEQVSGRIYEVHADGRRDGAGTGARAAIRTGGAAGPTSRRWRTFCAIARKTGAATTPP